MDKPDKRILMGCMIRGYATVALPALHHLLITKICAFLTVTLAAALSSLANTNPLEDFSPHLSTNTPIIWQAPTNHLPKNIWTYKRIFPRVLSADVISNAIVLGSLQSKGFPRPTTNWTCFTADEDVNCPCGHPCIFSISPNEANLNFSVRHSERGSGEDIPSDEVIEKRARDCASLMGLDPKQLLQSPLINRICNLDENGRNTTNHIICGRGVFLARQLDGISFFSAYNDGEGGEGFSIEVGSHGKIRSFSLCWSNLERDTNSPTVSPQQIINCIRAYKIMVIASVNEEGYLQRVKALANAKTLTITKITPHFGAGEFGVEPRYNELAKSVTPFAELEAVADLGGTNMILRLVCPVVTRDVIRLLKSN